MSSELGIGAIVMSPGGVDADEEPIDHIVNREPGRDQSQHLTLSWWQALALPAIQLDDEVNGPVLQVRRQG